MANSRLIFQGKQLNDGNVGAPAPSVADGQTLVYREEEGVTVEASAPKQRPNKVVKQVTMEEVAKHNTPEDLWIVVERKAYDITKFARSHPGGHLPLYAMAGKDATDAFEQYHPDSVWSKKLPNYHVGDVVGPKAANSAFVQEMRELRQNLLQRGLFETDMTFYYKKAAWIGSLFVLAVSLVVYGRGNTWVQLLGGCFLGCFWQQLAFIGHDTGHNGITHVQSVDNTIGIMIGNVLGGVSIGWWKRSHNVHHIVCNSIEHDPDIQHLPALCCDEKICEKPYWSTYHSKIFSMDAAARFIVSYQHYLFYPIMAFARFNLYLQGIILLIKEPKTVWKAHYEALGLVVFWAWFLTLCSYLEGTWTSVGFLVLSHAIAGILHVQICLSHFSMNVYSGNSYDSAVAGKGVQLHRQNGVEYSSGGAVDDWFRTQLCSTMNIACPEWMDWFHGGLQFQIEHHLFPRLPRHNLRHARALVKPFAEKHGIDYHEVGFLQSNLETLKGLKSTAMKARTMTTGDANIGESMLVAGLNAEG